MLREFIAEHREAILVRARSRVRSRRAPVATEQELTNGLPVFLAQLGDALRVERPSREEGSDHAAIQSSASEHGDALFRQGFSVAQVVHDYGDLCQVITELAGELGAAVAVGEFQTLNLCIDDAIASAVTAYGSQRERSLSAEGTERLGILAHEMRNLLNTAVLSFASIKKGIVAPGGSTSAIHDRSLMRMSTLIDRSLADVRLDAGMQNPERVILREVFEEIEISASLVAQARGLRLVLASIDPAVIVEADRQILTSAIANLVQNAVKFTRRETTVRVTASTTPTRILIEVEDECGGLPAGQDQSLLRPFVQRGENRTGLGLGLPICLKAVKAMGGELRIRDRPGEGCVFTIDLPRSPASARGF